MADTSRSKPTKRPTKTDPVRSEKQTRLLAVLAVLLLAIGGWLIARNTFMGKGGPPSGDASFPILALSDSPFLNTRLDVKYVGAEQCQSCHEDRHHSFRHTGMGRSMGPVTLEQAPPDGSYDHPSSKRRYQVQRRDGQLWHREFLLTSEKDPVLLAEFPMKYVIGSGRHTLTYATLADGFLVESPVTWYRSRNAWGMSPGYDRPNQPGFELPVAEGCLICHAGQSEALGGSLHQMKVIEPAIGCERCHGPGELHVAKHAGKKPEAGKEGRAADYTIVHPARLSRELGEAICQQCHLRSNATVPTRGHSPSEYRPGMPLQDFRQDYRFDGRSTSMTVTGHVEMMHLSKCYQQSKTMTCVTCHDPHNERTMTSGSSPALDTSRHDHYQAVCLSCHDNQACKVSPEIRKKERPDNYCVHCHMPTSPTDIPHMAFTHHRVGHHKPDANKKPDEADSRSEPASLKPFLDLSRLSEIDQKRSLGLGYVEAALKVKNPEMSTEYRQRGRQMLQQVRQDGLRDPVMDAFLAQLLEGESPEMILSLAKSALSQDQGVGGHSRCGSLMLLAMNQMRSGAPNEARDALRQLVKLRRQSMDWVLLGQVEAKLGNRDGEREALEQATRINPRLWQVHQYLADLYVKQGNKDKAAYHKQRAVP